MTEPPESGRLTAGSASLRPLTAEPPESGRLTAGSASLRPLTAEPVDLDLLPASAVVGLLLGAEERVLPVVRAARAELVAGAELIADRLRRGGRLVLLGAGTSGRLAVLQAAELPGTYGLPSGVVLGVTAGFGLGSDYDEDDRDAGRHDLHGTGIGTGDVLVAVAASGRTPYTLAAASAAAERGVAVVAVTTVAPSPLGELAAVAIELPVGPEVVRGSTRLTAGTAQKVALDALTTTAMVRLGRVHGDLMIDVVAANAKLRDRSVALVAEIAGCAEADARAALVACDWQARAAVVHLAAGLAPADAAEHAGRHETLRAALR